MRAKTLCHKPGCMNTRPCPRHRKPAFQNADAVLLPARWQIIRTQILQRDGYACCCGRQATHVDHVVPRCKGGTDEPNNLRAMCSTCHASKSGREGRDARL